MAAHSYLRLGRRLFYAIREGYAPTFAAIFRDDERRETPGPSSDDDVRIEFVVPVLLMRQRLEVLGYSLTAAQADIDRFYADSKGPAEERIDVWIATMVATIDDEWAEVGEVPFVALDERLVLRLLLEAAPDDAEFALDITEPVAWGLAEAPVDMCAVAFAELHSQTRAFGKLVVLTEGSTDAEFLTAAIDVLLSHLAGYVTFLDYYSNRPHGGVGALVRAVKAFAAAGIGNRVVAVFDNDTAAAEALTTLDEALLPANFRVVRLPRLLMAESYPTLGPTGETTWDVNGLACSLELYLGKDVLCDEGEALMPVQWRGYSTKLRRYQGELLDKALVHARYRHKVAVARTAGGPCDGQDWCGLRLVLDAILNAFQTGTRALKQGRPLSTLRFVTPRP